MPCYGCSKRRKDIQNWKVFADNIKTIVREKPYSIKEIHSIGRQVIKNTLTIKNMFHILDIFFNVEIDHTTNSITKLRVINSKNKYFLAHEYGEKGKVVCTSHDDETDKKILVKREPTNYKKFKDSEEKKSFIMKIE